MNVQPGITFEAVCDTGMTGYLGTIGLVVNDNIGGTAVGFTPATLEIATGVYSRPNVTAPTTQGQYTIIWTLGAGGQVVGVEDLNVTTSSATPIGPIPVPTPVAGGMTGAELITEFLADKRFGQNRVRVLGFLNYRYGEMLELEEWAFLRARASVTLDTGTVTAPADMGLPWNMYFADGSGELAQLGLDDFHDAYLGQPPGVPEAFTVFGATLLIGPAPDSSYPATLLYQSQPPWLADDEVPPVIPAEAHEGLVAGAQAFALELENDPTGGPLEARYQRTIDAMRRRYLTAGRGVVDRVPRDPLLR